MRDYALKMDKYGISREEYEELKWFCRQYPGKKRKLTDALNSSSRVLTGMPHGTNRSDPTLAAVIKRDKLLDDCRLIEQTAIRTDAELYQYLLQNTCCDESYEQINPPCSKRKFYETRRKFFFLLAKAKLGYFGAIEM